MGAPKSAASAQTFGVDDLFQDMHESADPGPFVINLSSSSVPISLPDKGIPLTKNSRIYQIRRVEDQRVRYRLRFGPFITEAQANAVLGIVREGYPAAFTAPAASEDLEAVADIQFETLTQQAAPAPKAAAVKHDSVAAKPTVVAEPAASKPTVAPAVAKAAPLAPPPAKPAPVAPAKTESAPAAARFSEVPTLAVPPVVQAVVKPKASAPAPAAKPAPAAAADSRRVPPSVVPKAEPAQKAPAIELQLMPDIPLPQKPAMAGKGPARAAPSTTLADQVSTFITTMILELEPDDKSRAERGSIADAPHRQAPPALKRAAEEQDDEVDLESTQTMRALTSAELADTNKMSHWFSIELSVSDRPFDPDAVPDLDIFSAYRLYVIESKGKAGAIHSLRLGFFGEEMAAKAVADYLIDHYQKPTVMRVSIAERERFSERRVEARKRVEGTGRHAVIEITDQRYVREVSLIQR